MNEWLLAQDGYTLYGGLFGLLLAGAFGLPMPEDIPLLLAGMLIERGSASPLPVFLVCYLALILGDVLIYFVGRYFGRRLYRYRWFRRRFPTSKVRALRLKLEKHSFATIIIARHLFYVRSMTFITCGIVRMRFARYLLADMLAGLLSCSVMLSLGYAFSYHLDTIAERLSKLHNILLLAFVAAAAAGVWWYRRRGRPPTPSSEARAEGASDESESALDALPPLRDQ